MKNIDWPVFGFGVIYAAAGIFFMVYPSMSSAILSGICAAGLIANGAYSFICYFRHKEESHSFSVGILCLVFGIYLLIVPELVQSFVPLLLAAAGILGSGRILEVWLREKNSQAGIFGLIGIGAGIVVLVLFGKDVQNAHLFITIGLQLLVVGAGMIVHVFGKHPVPSEEAENVQ